MSESEATARAGMESAKAFEAWWVGYVATNGRPSPEEAAEEAWMAAKRDAALSVAASPPAGTDAPAAAVLALADRWAAEATASREEAGRIRRTVKEATDAEMRCLVRAEIWDRCAAELRDAPAAACPTLEAAASPPEGANGTKAEQLREACNLLREALRGEPGSSIRRGVPDALRVRIGAFLHDVHAPAAPGRQGEGEAATSWDHRIIDGVSVSLGGSIGGGDDVERLLAAVTATHPKAREKTLAEIAVAFIRWAQDLKAQRRAGSPSGDKLCTIDLRYPGDSDPPAGVSAG